MQAEGGVEAEGEKGGKNLKQTCSEVWAQRSEPDAGPHLRTLR